MDGGLAALLGVAGALVGTITTAWVNSRKNHADEALAIAEGLRKDVDKLQAQVDRQQRDLDNWKGRYYLLLRRYNLVVVRLREQGIEVFDHEPNAEDQA